MGRLNRKKLSQNKANKKLPNTQNYKNSQYNLVQSGAKLSKYSDHRPADKTAPYSTRIDQDSSIKENVLSTAPNLHTATSTTQIDFSRLDRRIDEQEDRRISLQNSMTEKIDTVKTNLINREDDLRKELEGKINNGRKLCLWIIGICFSVISIILGIYRSSINSQLDKHDMAIESLKDNLGRTSAFVTNKDTINSSQSVMVNNKTMDKEKEKSTK